MERHQFQEERQIQVQQVCVGVREGRGAREHVQKHAAVRVMEAAEIRRY